MTSFGWRFPSETESFSRRSGWNTTSQSATMSFISETPSTRHSWWGIILLIVFVKLLKMLLVFQNRNHWFGFICSRTFYSNVLGAFWMVIESCGPPVMPTDISDSFWINTKGKYKKKAPSSHILVIRQWIVTPPPPYKSRPPLKNPGAAPGGRTQAYPGVRSNKFPLAWFCFLGKKCQINKIKYPFGRCRKHPISAVTHFHIAWSTQQDLSLIFSRTDL